MKVITVINGHPDKNSFNESLSAKYIQGARNSDAEVHLINVRELDFDPNLKYGYNKVMELEEDLKHSWNKIILADHLVWIHPVWWGGFPAILKGFIDRLFLPGKAFQYREDSIWWDRLLSGKSARIITTIDQPSWYYRFIYGSPSVKSLKRSVLKFCGVKPVKVKYFGSVRNSDEKKREKWLKQTYKMGYKQK